MAKTSENGGVGSKNIIIAVGTLVAIVIVVVLIVVFAGKGLNDSYFVSDDKKYVLTLTADEMGLNGGEVVDHKPLKMHTVWKYEGEYVTDMTIYYEYENATEARKAYDFVMEDKETNTEGYTDVKTDGKYLVMVADKSTYDGMKASAAKYEVEFMEMVRNDEFNKKDEDEDTPNAAGTGEATLELDKSDNILIYNGDKD